MDKTIAKLIADKEPKILKMEAMLLAAEDRDFTDEENTSYDGLEAECTSIDKKIERHEKLLTAKANTPVANKVEDVKTTLDDVERDYLKEASSKIKMPSMGRFASKLKCFTDEARQLVAFKQGQLLKAMMGNRQSGQWCVDNGLSPFMIQQEGVNVDGGYLVLPEFDANVVKLELQYGVFDRYARSVNMTSDAKLRDRKTGGLTMYAVGESQVITESSLTWDQFQLIARKWGVLSRITNELSADAIISVMDELAQDVAKASAQKKDEAGFLGDGTSTYHGIAGVSPELLRINGVDTGGGLILADGDLFKEITLANLNDLVSIVPDFPGIDPVWFCSKLFYHSVMEKLLTAAGGNTVTNIEQGGNRRIFLGYPVQFSNVMPKADTTSQIACLLGDLDMSSDVGDRQATTIALSDSATVGGENVFERDQKAVRWTERWDINNHDLGTATVAGPVVGLITAAS